MNTKQKIGLIDTKYKILLEQIEDYFASSNKSLHLARNQIKLIDFEQKKLVIKSFKIPNLINKIIYSFFKKSKAKKAYEFGQKITHFSPKSIAYIETYSYGLLGKSYVINEYFEFDFDIRNTLLDYTFANRVNIFKALAKFSYELHQAGIYHLDYSPGNILIKQSKTSYEFKIVDINRMRFINFSFADRAKSFSKLWASDDDLVIILTEYATLAGLSVEAFIRSGILYNNKNKKIKLLKRKIKQIMRL